MNAQDDLTGGLISWLRFRLTTYRIEHIVFYRIYSDMNEMVGFWSQAL